MFLMYIEETGAARSWTLYPVYTERGQETELLMNINLQRSEYEHINK